MQLSQNITIKTPFIKVSDNRTEGNKSNPLDSSSLINKHFHSCNEQQSSQYKNDESLCDTFQTKIQQLQLLNKLTSLQGLQIYNCKYKNIPHCLLRFRNDIWKYCFGFKLLHPSQPRFINNYHIINKIQPFKPGQDKLAPFLSYIKLINKHHPNFSPTKQSIFQSNGYPVILCKQSNNSWNQQDNIGLLCYYVVNGDDGNLRSQQIAIWAKQHSQTLLGKAIIQMNKQQRQKKKITIQGSIKPLLFCQEQQNDIW